VRDAAPGRCAVAHSGSCEKTNGWSFFKKLTTTTVLKPLRAFTGEVRTDPFQLTTILCCPAGTYVMFGFWPVLPYVFLSNQTE
jgi:hypothetical protein